MGVDDVERDLGDLAARRLLGELRRVPGVGRATLFSSEKALRIWIDPVKLVGFGMVPGDVTAAVSAQNAQVASGTIGAQPAVEGQRIAALVGDMNKAASAIERAAGLGQNEAYEEISYEGYGPGGVAVLVEAATDNRNRTAGEIRKIDKAASKITIKHGEIKNLDIPAMQMAFRVADPNWLKTLQVHDKVRFSADKVGGQFTITALEVRK